MPQQVLQTSANKLPNAHFSRCLTTISNFRCTGGEAGNETQAPGGSTGGFGELCQPAMLRGRESQRNDQMVQGFGSPCCGQQRGSVDVKQNAAKRHCDGLRAEIRAGQEKRRRSLFLQGGQHYR